MIQNGETTTHATSHISKYLSRTDPIKNSFPLTPLVTTRQIPDKEDLSVESFSFLQARISFLAASSVSSVKLFKFNEDFLRIAHLFNENHEIKPFLDSLEETIKFTETLPLNTRKNLFLFADFTLQHPCDSFVSRNIIFLENRAEKLFYNLKNTSSSLLTRENMESILGIVGFLIAIQTDPEIKSILVSFGEAICAGISLLILFNCYANQNRKNNK